MHTRFAFSNPQIIFMACTARRALRHLLPLLLCAAPLTLTGCLSSVAVGVVGAAVDVALETSGIRKRAPDNGERTVSLRLDTGATLNSTADGEPLALLVRIYQLKSDAGFASLPYQQFLDRAGEQNALGEDLVSVRELTLLPGKTYALQEKMPARAKVLAVVALFHNPAAARWKYAFDRDASLEAGIALGLHTCSITVAQGVLTNPIIADGAASLAGVRCGT
jgi:type VI secretion system protein VasD